MLGAVIGDLVGSRFEWDNYKAKDFEFLTYKCFPTDDSVMTLALAKAILISNSDYSDLEKNAVECMQSIGRNYPDCGYGAGFYRWIFSDDPRPYNSYGNGAAMQVSSAGFAAGSLEEAKKLSAIITGVTHNHPEGLKGAEAVAVAVFWLEQGAVFLKSGILLTKITILCILLWTGFGIPMSFMSPARKQFRRRLWRFLSPRVLRMQYEMRYPLAVTAILWRQSQEGLRRHIMGFPQTYGNMH